MDFTGFDINSLAAETLRRADAHGITITTAESCTGGLIFATLTGIAGSSTVMERGFITYSNAAKQEMLGVDAALISDHGAVSEPVAQAMAEGALAASPADIAIAVTGVAGPGASGPKPEGRVCFALARRGAACRVQTRDFGPLGRDNVRRATVVHALVSLMTEISSSPQKSAE